MHLSLFVTFHCLFSAAELEMIKSLFNEKEKELTMAVTKVEELTKQLEELRNGHVNSLTGDNKHSSPAFLELEKLRKELMVRGTATQTGYPLQGKQHQGIGGGMRKIRGKSGNLIKKKNMSGNFQPVS